MHPVVPHELRCPDCAWRTVCAAGEMALWLTKAGMLKRTKEPEPELLVELFSASAGKFVCPDCGRVGLACRECPEDQDDWGQARACAACGQRIPPERIELFPDVQLCAACAGAGKTVEQGEPEYCPRCGGLMELRPSGGAGIRRYVMVCRDCRR